MSVRPDGHAVAAAALGSVAAKGAFVPLDPKGRPGRWLVKACVTDGPSPIAEVTLYDDAAGIGKTLRHVIAADASATDGLKLLAWEVASWQAHDLWPKSPGESIRGWYVRTFPDDELGHELDDVPFFQYLVESARAGSCYVCGVGDSVVRNRLEAALDEAMGCQGSLVRDLIYAPGSAKQR